MIMTNKNTVQQELYNTIDFEKITASNADIKTYQVQTICVLAFFHFLFNFLYSPVLKWFYLLEIIPIAYYCFRLHPPKSYFSLFFLFFIEGQGRILWDYNAIMRVLFDLICALILVKSISYHKKIISKKMPFYFEAALYLHFAWYGIQLFNVNNVGIFPVIAASKIYIFPFLIFLMQLLNPIDIFSKEFKQLQIFLVFMILGECVLAWFQMHDREMGMEQISQYYSTAMKDEVFVGSLFRPFGTTHLPGAVSIYLVTTVGFLLLPSWRGLVRKLVTLLTLTMSWFALYTCQVRSAMAKHILISLSCILAYMFIGKFKGKNLIPIIGFITIGYFVLMHTNIGTDLVKDINLESAAGRYSMLEEGSTISVNRIGPDKFIEQFASKLYSAPLGLGPGRTGAASSLGSEYINSDPIFGSVESWGFDNLFIALAIDFGIGMVFYTFLIFGIPLYLIYSGIIAFIRKESIRAQIILVAGITGIVLVVGNWGAIALPYNPESFMFWFWMALGLNTCHSIKVKANQLKSTEDAGINNGQSKT